MDFSNALLNLKNGLRVARSGWNGNGMWLDLQIPDEHSKMTLPYIYMSTAQGDFVPWLASQTDILATDWEVLTPEQVIQSLEQSIDTSDQFSVRLARASRDFNLAVDPEESR